MRPYRVVVPQPLHYKRHLDTMPFHIDLDHIITITEPEMVKGNRVTMGIITMFRDNPLMVWTECETKWVEFGEGRGDFRPVEEYGKPEGLYRMWQLFEDLYFAWTGKPYIQPK